ncbi:hypothetical protein FP329_002632 [Enterococcus faecium]|nr:hypothetical protein [Enterococcus faecium]
MKKQINSFLDWGENGAKDGAKIGRTGAKDGAKIGRIGAKMGRKTRKV